MANLERPSFEFQRRGGYDQEAVNSYITKTLSQIEKLQSQIVALEESVNQNSLKSDDNQPEVIELSQVINAARDMSIRIEDQANRRAEQIIEEANRRAEQEYQARVAELDASISALVKFELEMKARKAYFEAQVSLIKSDVADSISNLIAKANATLIEIEQDMFDPQVFTSFGEAPSLSKVGDHVREASSLSFDDIFSDLGVEFDQ